MHNVKWQVSLSNGETFYENKGNFTEIPGELSPWQKLIRYIADNKLHITSISLFTKDGRTFNLPSAGKNPKFKPFLDTEKPLDYNMCRYMSRDMHIVGKEVKGVRISELFTVVEAIYPKYKLQLWVDENNPRNMWTLIIQNK